MTEITITHKYEIKMMKKELNKKEIKKNLPCDLFLSKLFSMKNSFIKNYEAFEGKVCIGYVYTLAEKVI